MNDDAAGLTFGPTPERLVLGGNITHHIITAPMELRVAFTGAWPYGDDAVLPSPLCVVCGNDVHAYEWGGNASVCAMEYVAGIGGFATVGFYPRIEA